MTSETNKSKKETFYSTVLYLLVPMAAILVIVVGKLPGMFYYSLPCGDLVNKISRWVGVYLAVRRVARRRRPVGSQVLAK